MENSPFLWDFLLVGPTPWEWFGWRHFFRDSFLAWGFFAALFAWTLWDLFLYRRVVTRGERGKTLLHLLGPALYFLLLALVGGWSTCHLTSSLNWRFWVFFRWAGRDFRKVLEEFASFDFSYLATVFLVFFAVVSRALIWALSLPSQKWFQGFISQMGEGYRRRLANVWALALLAVPLCGFLLGRLVVEALIWLGGGPVGLHPWPLSFPVILQPNFGALDPIALLSGLVGVAFTKGLGRVFWLAQPLRAITHLGLGLPLLSDLLALLGLATFSPEWFWLFLYHWSAFWDEPGLRLGVGVLALFFLAGVAGPCLRARKASFPEAGGRVSPLVAGTGALVLLLVGSVLLQSGLALAHWGDDVLFLELRQIKKQAKAAFKAFPGPFFAQRSEQASCFDFYFPKHTGSHLLRACLVGPLDGSFSAKAGKVVFSIVPAPVTYERKAEEFSCSIGLKWSYSESWWLFWTAGGKLFYFLKSDPRLDYGFLVDVSGKEIGGLPWGAYGVWQTEKGFVLAQFPPFHSPELHLITGAGREWSSRPLTSLPVSPFISFLFRVFPAYLVDVDFRGERYLVRLLGVPLLPPLWFEMSTSGRASLAGMGVKVGFLVASEPAVRSSPPGQQF